MNSSEFVFKRQSHKSFHHLHHHSSELSTFGTSEETRIDGRDMTATSLNAPGSRSWALLLFLSFVWGGAFMSMAMALEQYGPFTDAAGRIGI